MVDRLQLQAYPNPFSDNVTVALTAPASGKAKLQLVDLQGRVLLIRDIELDRGLNQLELKLHQIAGGIYLLKVSGNGVDATTRVMKTH